jgi:two-component system, NarL family, invasion response regulator UvrY
VSTAKRIGLLLVDDHAVVRAGYRLLLQNLPDIEIVAEAETGEQACRLYAEHKPDVVVMDLSLPGIGGLEAVRRIMARDRDARILVFSMHENTMFVEQALAAGARGYITKSSAPKVLVDAVRNVAAGCSHLDGALAQQLVFQKVRERDSALMGLSIREFEIFCLLAEGLSANEIGKRLSLSYKTIANYTTQVKNKLGCDSMADLVRMAIRHGIVNA